MSPPPRAPATSPSRAAGPATRSSPLTLDSPLAELPRINRVRLAALSRMGLRTISDLLWHLPRRHEDQRQRLTVEGLQIGQPATLEVEVVAVHSRHARHRRLELVEGQVRDASGTLNVIWFNQPHLRHLLHPGDQVTLHGKPIRGRDHRLLMRNPEVGREGARTSQVTVGGLEPVYAETAGLTSRWLRPQLRDLVQGPLLISLDDPLPEWLRTSEGLLPLAQALRQVHDPADETQLAKAQERIGFDDLFYPQLAALIALRRRLGRPGVRTPYRIEIAQEFSAGLPFRLTDDQRRAAHQILIDMDRPAPMNRLLQGDVGSGKTVVAAMAARMAVAADHQVVLMAPTEILARQHFLTLQRLLAPWEIEPVLLVGSTKARARRDIHENLAAGNESLVVGTHALVEDKVEIPNLGLSIVDEQHRFGVDQRLRLRNKRGLRPDSLTMTATPIPRSLASTLYGHLDISQLRTRPPGRVPVETCVVEPEGRDRAYQLIREQVRQGRQGFIICPLVEDTPSIEARSASAEHLRLQAEVFPDLRLGLLHGRLSAAEKSRQMEAFGDGALDLLVTTSLIEVGVDFPNASVVAIEDAARFGLAQLHQLRGRVGRGEHASYCLLFAAEDDGNARRRLQALVDHQDGFEVAEMDLSLRGPGDPLGLRQHGYPEMRVGDLLDQGLRERARHAAELVLERDPSLGDQRLRQTMKRYQLVLDID